MPFSSAHSPSYESYLFSQHAKSGEVESLTHQGGLVYPTPMEKLKGDCKDLVTLSETQLFCEPPVEPGVEYLLDPRIPGRIHHICTRKSILGKNGPAEVVRFGLVRWCPSGRFWCTECNVEMDFDLLWDVYEPIQEHTY